MLGQFSSSRSQMTARLGTPILSYPEKSLILDAVAGFSFSQRWIRESYDGLVKISPFLRNTNDVSIPPSAPNVITITKCANQIILLLEQMRYWLISAMQFNEKQRPAGCYCLGGPKQNVHF